MSPNRASGPATSRGQLLSRYSGGVSQETQFGASRCN